MWTRLALCPPRQAPFLRPPPLLHAAERLGLESPRGVLLRFCRRSSRRSECVLGLFHVCGVGARTLTCCATMRAMCCVVLCCVVWCGVVVCHYCMCISRRSNMGSADPQRLGPTGEGMVATQCGARVHPPWCPARLFSSCKPGGRVQDWAVRPH